MNIKAKLSNEATQITKHMSKNETYDYLLKVTDDKLEGCIADINNSYGYEYINKYELARYQILINNKSNVAARQTEEIDLSSLFDSSRTQRSKQECDEIKKDLQKAYMKLLANQ